ncbi:sensor histidine kinase [Devosia sp.]|uniref:sensor histidine kinase n=1 Tax=Devosia sp. TaxID=1871048 RepID=UPI003A910B5D
MPQTRKRVFRNTLALLAVGLLALIAIVGTVIYLGEESQRYFDDVIEAVDARAAAVDLRDAMRMAETNQRGYLITGDSGYLDDYQLAKTSMMPRFEDLRTILSRYAEAEAPLAALQATLEAKLAEMDQTISLYESGQQDEATALVRTGRGSNLSETVMEFVNGVVVRADGRMKEGVSHQVNTAQWLRVVSVIGGLLIIVVVGGSALTVWRYTQEISATRDRFAAFNTELEKRVQARTADLEEANEEVQRFAYIVTHDLRAPLVNIMGFTAELEEGIKTLQTLISPDEAVSEDGMEQARLAATEDLPEAIQFIRSSTNKMDGLINAILKLSREGRRTLKAEPIDLEEMLENAGSAIAHQLADGEGEMVTDVSVKQITSDRLSLEQAIGNLLDNASKYRSKSRPLRIEVRVVEAPGQMVRIEVADNGRGIADQDKARVFEPFRRSGVQDQAGEGIGLAYVRTIVRNLGGEITMSSVLGEGTTFRITLPKTLQIVGSTA